MTGVRDGELVHWSDMLAVRPEARDHGIGRRLKLYQRSLVAELGVTQILWTFDPLVSRNAHLNLNALGARVTDYVPDMYGADTGSALHQGIGTDRFVVAWEVSGDVSGAAGQMGSGDGGRDRSGTEVVVEIPQDIHQLIAVVRRPPGSGGSRPALPSSVSWPMGIGGGFERSPTGGFYRLTRGTD